ncbi:hypothetical protein R6V09_29990, partial [Streptomyces sp. W16]|nr:hypothetical protein [Streptomyces sp. W16]
MSQQGGTPPGHEDDWWGQLYDDSTDDTGPTAAADSLEDRFASASGTVDEGASPVPGTVDEGVRPLPGTAGGVARPVPGTVDENARPVAASGVPAPRAGVTGSAPGGTADADPPGHRPP